MWTFIFHIMYNKNHSFYYQSKNEKNVIIYVDFNNDKILFKRCELIFFYSLFSINDKVISLNFYTLHFMYRLLINIGFLLYWVIHFNFFYISYNLLFSIGIRSYLWENWTVMIMCLTVVFVLHKGHIGGSVFPIRYPCPCDTLDDVNFYTSYVF